MKDADVIVVGGGISGLLSALVLSKEGKRVLLLEKENFLGGNACSYTVGDFQVDTGPHAITYIHDGPLARIMQGYFDVVPTFLPYGTYYVRDKHKLTPFPWTLQEWVTFSILPRKDRLELVQLLISAIASPPLKKNNLDKTVKEFIGCRSFSEKTWRFIDAICYFMSGKSMGEAPAWRLLRGARYLEERKENQLERHVRSISKLRKLIRYNGAYHQAYPKAGLQAITDSILSSLPKKKVVLKRSEKVERFTFSSDRVSGVATDKDVYTADYVVYSGMVKNLPSLTKNMLPKEYAENLGRIKTTTSITLWLGLKKPHPQLNYLGSEIWFEEGNPYWGMPTSNYNPDFAPGGRQIVGFTSFAEDLIEKEKKNLKETVYKALPGIEDLVSLEHYQIACPEKAAVTVGVKFPETKSPLEGLYLVGTDTDMRSMGITRAAFSVETLLEMLRREKKIL